MLWFDRLIKVMIKKGSTEVRWLPMTGVRWVIVLDRKKRQEQIRI